MKSIKELSESLGISKESVYKKIKYQLKVELKGHVFKGSGGMLIDEIGESLILQSLRKERSSPDDESMEAYNVKLEVDSTTFSTLEQPDIVNEAQVENPDLIVLLKQQIEVKDNQIVSLMESRDEQMRNKDLQIEQLLKINEQLIVTFQNEQKIKVAGVLKLPGSASAQQDETAAPMGEHEPPKKSFISRIFKKK